jgi:hypothetical protein
MAHLAKDRQLFAAGGQRKFSEVTQNLTQKLPSEGNVDPRNNGGERDFGGSSAIGNFSKIECDYF